MKLPAAPTPVGTPRSRARISAVVYMELVQGVRNKAELQARLRYLGNFERVGEAVAEEAVLHRGE